MEQIIETIIKNRQFLKTLPFLALSAAVFFWGGSFVGMRVVLRTLDPMIVMWFRMVTALIIILPFSKKLIRLNYIKGDWKLLLPMVLFQPCLYFLLESYALRLTTATQAGVISASVPVLVTFGAWIFLSESINKRTITGLLLSVTGVIFLTLSQRSGSSAENPVLGNIMEISAMVFAAANMIIIKKLSNRYNPWTLTAMQIVAGVLFFSPGMFKILKMDSSLWTTDLFLILIFLGSFVSLGAFGLYNWGMSHINASKASLFINLIPVTAIITGWLMLGETLNMIQSISALIVILGVLLSQKSMKKGKIK